MLGFVVSGELLRGTEGGGYRLTCQDVFDPEVGLRLSLEGQESQRIFSRSTTSVNYRRTVYRLLILLQELEIMGSLIQQDNFYSKGVSKTLPVPQLET